MKSKLRHGNFFKSAVVITAGGLVAKLIGACYRIPLTGILGGYGMGLYQMAYPFFCVLLTFSSAGIPTAFSRIIAREQALEKESGNTVRAALKLFAVMGLSGAITMCLLAQTLARAQGNGALVRCYFALAPSVFFVALIAVFRGYFQGKNDMLPTAFSAVVESAVKASFGLFFAFRYQNEPTLAVFFALLAVSVSELVSLCYLFMRYRGERKSKLFSVRKGEASSIFRVAFPVMAAASLLPISKMVDSVLVVRLLSRYESNAVALYGLFSGGAISLVGIPASLCYGLATASVPAVSSHFAKGDEEEGRRRALFSLTLTLTLALPCALGLFFFARPIVSLLYSSLSVGESQTLVRLIRLTAFSSLSLAGIDVLASCLAGMGRAKYSARAMLVAVLCKLLLQIFLLSYSSLSIYGVAIAESACYLVAFFLDLVYTVKKRVGRKKTYDNGNRRRRGSRRFNGASTCCDAGGKNGVVAKRSVPLRGTVKGGKRFL